MRHQNLKTAGIEIEEVAKKLEARGHNHTKELRVIAQFLMSPEEEMEMGGGHGVQEMLHGGTQFDPSMHMESGMGDGMDEGVQPFANKGKHMHPSIPSFVQPAAHESSEAVDPRMSHTCTVQFLAAPNVPEHKMMNFILGIEENLDVEVRGFNWSKKEQKVSKASVGTSLKIAQMRPDRKIQVHPDQEQEFDPSGYTPESDMGAKAQPFAREEKPEMHLQSPEYQMMPGTEGRMDHTCTVNFIAPPDVPEHAMMNFILGIEGKLGVEVRGFNWSKKEQKTPS